MAKVRSTGITDEAQIRRILREEGYFNLFRWCDDAGSRYGVHTHPHREVRWILSGRLMIREGDEWLSLGPGDRMESEAEVPHEAFAPEDVCYLCASR